MTIEQKLLKQIIAETGLNVTQFAKKIGRTQGQVSGWITGQRSIKLNTLVEIANRVGYTVYVDLKKY